MSSARLIRVGACLVWSVACVGPAKPNDSADPTESPADSRTESAPPDHSGGDSGRETGVETGDEGGGDSVAADDTGEVSPFCVGVPSGGRAAKICGEVAGEMLGWDLSEVKGEAAVLAVGCYQTDLHTSGQADVVLLDAPTPASSLSSYPSVGAGVDDMSRAFGAAVSATSDLDGDGYADLAVGAPLATVTVDQRYAGRVHIFDGPFPADRDLTTYDAALDGFEWMNQFGAEVVGLPDVDGDGDDELLVGTDDSASSVHMANLFLGPIVSEGRLEADASYERSGCSSGDQLAVVDLDGDGVEEILNVDEDDADGTPGGEVFVTSSELRGEVNLDDQLSIVHDEDELIIGGIYGLSVGDTTGDGYGDVAIQIAAFPSFVVRIALFEGPLVASIDTSSSSAIAESPVVSAAHSPKIVGDVDGDGQSGDLLVGIGYSEEVYLVPRPLSGTTTLGPSDLITTGETGGGSDGDLFGLALAPLPDLDGDGADELLIAAPRNDEGGTDAGAVYLLYGASW